MIDINKNEIHKKLSDSSVRLTYKFWNLKRAQITQRPSENEWCPLEILIHLRQVAEVYTERVKRLVNAKEEDSIPHFHDYDEFKMMEKINLEEETPKANINTFLDVRSDMLNLISFDDEIWETKSCIHEVEGEISLRKLLIPLVLREQKFLDILEELLPE